MKCCLMQHFIWVFTVCQSTCTHVPVSRMNPLHSIPPTYQVINCLSWDKNIPMILLNLWNIEWSLRFKKLYFGNISSRGNIFSGCPGDSSMTLKVKWTSKNNIMSVNTKEPWHVVCATSKASDQQIRAFASRLSILWLLSYWLNIIWSI